MKTSELRKVVEENNYIFEKDLTSIYIKDNSDIVMKMDEDSDIRLGVGYFLSSNKIKTVMKALIEYSLTPISEREDEKKYYIEFNTDNLDVATCYLYKMENGKLRLHDVIKHFFTQSEIDDFPAEIKGAIECGFLRKVEVE